MIHLARVVALVLAVVATGAPAFAQSVRGVIVDQTGLPLPGATVQVLDGTTVVTTLTSGADGTFVIDGALPGSSIVASLQGFEETRVTRAGAARITLLIARTEETTTVLATAGEPASPSAPLLGNTLNANTVARLPSSHFRARESL